MKHDRLSKAPRENGVRNSSSEESSEQQKNNDPSLAKGHAHTFSTSDSSESCQRKESRRELDVLFRRMAQIYRWVKKMDTDTQERALEFMETVIRQRQECAVPSAADMRLTRKLHNAYGFLDVGADLSDAEYGTFLRVQIENEGRVPEKQDTAGSSSASTATPADTALLAAVSDDEVVVDPYYRAIADASEDSDDSYDPLSESPRAVVSGNPCEYYTDVYDNGIIDDEISRLSVRPPLKAYAIERSDASLIGVEIYVARVIATPQSDGYAMYDASAVFDNDMPLDAYAETYDNADGVIGFEGNVSNKSSEETDSDLDWTILAAPTNSDDGEDVQPDTRDRTESAAKRRRCNFEQNSENGRVEMPLDEVESEISEQPRSAQSSVARTTSDNSNARDRVVQQQQRRSSLLRNAVVNSKAFSISRSTMGRHARRSNSSTDEAACIFNASTADTDIIWEEPTVHLSQQTTFNADGFRRH